MLHAEYIVNDALEFKLLIAQDVEKKRVKFQNFLYVKRMNA